MKKLLAVAFSVLPSLALADYRTQIDLSYQHTKTDYDDESYLDNDESNIALNANIYFGAVSTEGVPLAEADFLDKSSFVSISHRKTKYEFEDFFEGDETETTNRLGVHTVIADRVILGGNVAKVDWDGGDYKNWGFVAGAYITDHSSLDLSMDMEYSSSYGSLNSPLKLVLVNYRSVYELASSQSLGIRLGLGRYEIDISGIADATALHFGGDWYFNNRFSTGIEVFAYSNGDYTEAKTTISTKYFFNEHFSIEGGLVSGSSTDDEDDSDSEEFGFRAGLAVRF